MKRSKADKRWSKEGRNAKGQKMMKKEKNETSG